MEKDDFLKSDEAYFVQAYKRDLKFPPGGRLFDRATETAKLQTQFWDTKYSGVPFREFYVSLQQFSVKSLDVIYTDKLFTLAHFKANFRLQLSEYVPTNGKLAGLD